jgi:hypothetical protein
LGPGGSPPPPHNNRNLVIVVSVGVLALAAVITVGIMLSRKSNPTPLAVPVSVSPSIIGAGPSGATPTSTTPIDIPWQTVTDHGAAIDVPPDWVLKPASNDNPHVAADYKEGACSIAGVTGENRAEVMVASTNDADLSTGATNIVNELVPIVYGTGNPQATRGQLQPANAGGFQDLPVTIKLTPTDACTPPGGVMHVLVHAADRGGTFALIVVGDQGVSDGLSPDVLNRIAAGARSAN